MVTFSQTLVLMYSERWLDFLTIGSCIIIVAANSVNTSVVLYYHFIALCVSLLEYGSIQR